MSGLILLPHVCEDLYPLGFQFIILNAKNELNPRSETHALERAPNFFVRNFLTWIIGHPEFNGRGLGSAPCWMSGPARVKNKEAANLRRPFVRHQINLAAKAIRTTATTPSRAICSQSFLARSLVVTCVSMCITSLNHFDYTLVADRY